MTTKYVIELTKNEKTAYLHPSGLSLVPFFFSKDQVFSTKKIRNKDIVLDKKTIEEIIDKKIYNANLLTDVNYKELTKYKDLSVLNRIIRPSSIGSFTKSYLEDRGVSYWERALDSEISFNQATSMGTYFHKLFENRRILTKEELLEEGIFVVDSWSKSGEPTRTSVAFEKVLAELKTNYPRTIPKAILTAEESKIVNECFSLYKNTIDDFFSSYDIIGTEINAEIKNYLDTEWSLKGTCDLVLKNKETGRYLVVDLKTSTSVKNVFDYKKVGTNMYDSHKLFQGISYVVLVANKLNLDITKIDFMYLPIYINTREIVFNPIEYNNIITEVAELNKWFLVMKSFLEDRFLLKEIHNKKTLRKTFVVPKVRGFDSLQGESEALERLLELDGILLTSEDKLFLQHKGETYIVYTYKLYQKILQKRGLLADILELRAGEEVPPLVAEGNSKYSIAKGWVRVIKPESKVIGVFAMLKDSQGYILQHEFYSNDDLKKHETMFSNLKSNSAWEDWAKNMNYKSALKLILNKHLINDNILSTLYKIENLQAEVLTSE